MRSDAPARRMPNMQHKRGRSIETTRGTVSLRPEDAHDGQMLTKEHARRLKLMVWNGISPTSDQMLGLFDLHRDDNEITWAIARHNGTVRDEATTRVAAHCGIEVRP